MTRLTWGDPGSREFETGVDRGVLFVKDNDGVEHGYAWQGLIAVSEAPDGGAPRPYYLDGVKYINVAGDEEFGGNIEAFTFPDAFALCDGSAEPQPGLKFHQQRKKSFGLSYRTLIGNDTEGTDYAYKIHLVYNALATPVEVPYETGGEEPEPVIFNWDFTTKPVPTGVGYMRTAHVTIESNKVHPDLLEEIENLIYGTGGSVPTLPTPEDLLAMFEAFNTVPPPPPDPNVAPEASFDAVISDLEVMLTSTSFDSDGTIVTTAWNFGDGNTSSEASTQHTYATAGTYTITLTVTDDDGATDSAIQEVTVTAPVVVPSADIEQHLFLRGINVAGGEFNHTASGLPGTYGVDYAYDSQQALNDYASRGHLLIRAPFRMERVIDANGDLIIPGIEQLRDFLVRIANTGMWSAPDMHNYGEVIYDGVTRRLGADLPDAEVVNAWVKIRNYLVAENVPNIYGWYIMNEPHDLPNAPPEMVAETLRYDWDDGTVQGWTGDSATASNVDNKLRLSGSPAADGFFQLRKDDAATNRNNTTTNRGLGAVVTMSGIAGEDWSVQIQYQNASYQWINPITVYYTRLDTGEAVNGLIDGVPVEVLADYSGNFTPQAFAIEVKSNNATGGQTYTADIDNFRQGLISTGVKTWPRASQAIVDGLRGAGDDKWIFVPGDEWQGIHEWKYKNPDYWWITDPLRKSIASGHYYFDIDFNGNFDPGTDTYAAADAWAQTQGPGHASLLDMITYDLEEFAFYCEYDQVKAFIGEFGWRTNGTADVAQWEAAGAHMIAEMDRLGIGGTYWAAGEWWPSDYPLIMYTHSPFEPNDTALIFEASPSGDTLGPGGLLSLNAYSNQTNPWSWWPKVDEDLSLGTQMTGFDGDRSLRVARDTGTTALAQARLNPNERRWCVEGETIAVSSQLRMGSEALQGAIGIEFYANELDLISTVWGATTQLSTTAWTEVTAQAVAPEGAKYFGIIVGQAPGTPSHSRPYYVDATIANKV